MRANKGFLADYSLNSPDFLTQGSSTFRSEAEIALPSLLMTI
jgi:hypothetical protein